MFNISSKTQDGRLMKPWDLIRLRKSLEWRLALWQWFEDWERQCSYSVNVIYNSGLTMRKSFDGSSGKPNKMNVVKKH